MKAGGEVAVLESHVESSNGRLMMLSKVQVDGITVMIVGRCVRGVGTLLET